MKLLTNDRAELIEALVAESSLGGITTSLLEKDEHLTDALRAIFALKFEYVDLVFCGGTSLSKAHSLIERMSEDADLKVVLTEAGKLLSRSALKRYLGDEVRKNVAEALSKIGLVEDEDKAMTLNEYRYMHSQWSYQRRYPISTGLRPNLQLELTLRAPMLDIASVPIYALADRLAGKDGAPFEVKTISVAETLAEKVLSFLRRFAQHRSGQMRGTWDTALVRHIYDVHCIVTHDSDLIELAVTAFKELVNGDVTEFGKQQPDFAEKPLEVLEKALAQVEKDEQSRSEYEKNLLPLVYGDFKPHFDEAFSSFKNIALQLLAK